MKSVTVPHEPMSPEARSALAEVYAYLCSIAQREAPPWSGGASVASPELQSQGADDVNSRAHHRPSMETSPSDRALGAESHPGLGGRRRPRKEV